MSSNVCYTFDGQVYNNVQAVVEAMYAKIAELQEIQRFIEQRLLHIEERNTINFVNSLFKDDPELYADQ